jgi:hypothetical protein
VDGRPGAAVSGIVVGDLDLERQADQITRLYQRYAYGAAIGNGLPLTGDDFAAMMAQNALVCCLVAEIKGKVVGLLGGLRIDGARSSDPGRVWGDHFVIDAGVRGSFVAGQLVWGLFDRLTDQGITSINLRINPNNRLASSLYARIGCRAKTGARPDCDGFLEVVSHLPSLVRTTRLVAAENPSIRLPRLSFSSLRGLRGHGFDEGVVVDPDGRWHILYHVADSDVVGDLWLDGDSGQIERIVSNGVDYSQHYRDFQLSHGLVAPARPRPAATAGRLRLGDFALSLDSWGGLRIDHPRQLGPLLVDCFPDGQGHTVAYRRPPRSEVVIVGRPDGWTARRPDGLERVHRLVGRVIEVECRLGAGQSAPDQLAVHPWVGLRPAEFSLAPADRAPLAGPLRPGRWPPRLPAYEAAGDAQWSYPAQGAVSRWIDRTAGLAVEIEWLDPGRLRAEGECRAHGPQLCYRLRLHDALDPEQSDPAWFDSDRFDSDPAAPAPTSPAAVLAPPLPRPPLWSDAGRARPRWRRCLAPGEGELLVDPAAGLMGWRAGGRWLLEKPANHGFGALTAVPAALWASLDSDRCDIDRGAEWSGADPRIGFAESLKPVAGDVAQWSVVAAADDLTALELVTDVPAVFAGREAALHLKPNSQTAVCWMDDSAGRPRLMADRDQVERPWGLWWGFTRRLCLPVGQDQLLELRPLAGDQPEILVRWLTAGPLISLLARVGAAGRSQARWSLRLISSSHPGRQTSDPQPK